MLPYVPAVTPLFVIENVVPLNVKPVPALYVVLLSVNLAFAGTLHPRVKPLSLSNFPVVPSKIGTCALTADAGPKTISLALIPLSLIIFPVVP